MLVMNGNAMMNPTAVIRRRFVHEKWLYYPPLLVDADHAFWVNCIANGAVFANLGESLLDYRIHGENTTRQNTSLVIQGKTPLRKQLLGLYLPDLSGRECTAIAAIMEDKRSLSLYEMYAGVQAIDKSLRTSHCAYGVDVKTLKHVLNYYKQAVLQQIETALKPQAQSKNTDD